MGANPGNRVSAPAREIQQMLLAPGLGLAVAGLWGVSQLMEFFVSLPLCSNLFATVPFM